MSKIRDDWMYPKRRPAVAYTAKDPKEKPFLIVRLRGLEPCTWAGSPPKPRYHKWSAFATREERDAELKRLRETTEWDVRAARLDIMGHGWDLEDDETDLMARLARLRLRW